jgi:hypothetical protein
MKHIDIRYHFLRHHEANGDIALRHVSTEWQLANIFTKPLDEQRFCALRNELNILDSRNLAWLVADICLLPDKKNEFTCVDLFWKSWILIFGSKLDSCDHYYVLLFLADHQVSSCLICLQAIFLKISNSFNIKIYLFGAVKYFLELPTLGRNFRHPSEVSGKFEQGVLRRLDLVSPELSRHGRNFWRPSEVSAFFRPRVLRSRILLSSELSTPVGTSNNHLIYIYPLDSISKPQLLIQTPPTTPPPLSTHILEGISRINQGISLHLSSLDSPLFRTSDPHHLSFNSCGINNWGKPFKILAARFLNVERVRCFFLGDSFMVHHWSYA